MLRHATTAETYCQWPACRTSHVAPAVGAAPCGPARGQDTCCQGGPDRQRHAQDHARIQPCGGTFAVRLKQSVRHWARAQPLPEAWQVLSRATYAAMPVLSMCARKIYRC